MHEHTTPLRDVIAEIMDGPEMRFIRNSIAGKTKFSRRRTKQRPVRLFEEQLAERTIAIADKYRRAGKTINFEKARALALKSPPTAAEAATQEMGKLTQRTAQLRQKLDVARHSLGTGDNDKELSDKIIAYADQQRKLGKRCDYAMAKAAVESQPARYSRRSHASEEDRQAAVIRYADNERAAGRKCDYSMAAAAVG